MPFQSGVLNSAVGVGDPLTEYTDGPRPWAYTVFQLGSTFMARNGTTGLIDFSGASLASVLSAAQSAAGSAPIVDVATTPGLPNYSGKVLQGLQTPLAGTPGQSGLPGVTNYSQLALVEGTFALPVNAGAGAASPPQVNIQRYITPNDDGSGAGSPGVFVASTRYGDGTSGNGDMHDYYNLFSIGSTSATADLGAQGGHGVIGVGAFGKALTGSNKARVWGEIALAQLASGSTNGKAIGIEIDTLNSVGTDAPDISSGQADGMTVGLNFGAFGNKNSTAILVQASGAAASYLQGLTFYANSVAPAGYIINAPNLTANILRTAGITIASTGQISVLGSATYGLDLKAGTYTGNAAIRLPNTGIIMWRNAGDSADVAGIQMSGGIVTVSSSFKASTLPGIGFYGTAATAKQTVTGAKGSNAALASLLTALSTLGLITDSSSA